MDLQKLSNLLFPNVSKNPCDIEKQYPKRELPQGAMVTRIAPSPTGFMHLGNLFGAICDERLAHQSSGVFYLRIEDTDAKREVEGGVETIINVFKYFGLNFDEGATIDGFTGQYGPYKQSQRADIYHVYAKQLVEKGLAYPCFCTEETLSQMREEQASKKDNFGYFGSYANCRNLTMEQIEEKIKNGDSYVLRFKSQGSIQNYIKHIDLVKGDMEIPENDQDFVLLKSDGIPTYHFAHVVDDHLMRTTHVVRGEEWLSTLPIHLQLFDALEFERPRYVHTAQLMKLENGNKRKLSKRKDPELALDYYHSLGYSVQAVLEYLMTLLNSNFEEWRIENPDKDIKEFEFTTEKMSKSGALFDLDKFRDVSKNIISVMDAQSVYDLLCEYLQKYDKDFFALVNKNPDYTKAIINIGRGGAKPRKDIACWSEYKDYMSLFFDELFEVTCAFPENIAKEDIKAILTGYIKNYNQNDDNECWFNKIKELAKELGFAEQTKLYKKNPQDYKGHIGDVSMVLRIAVTGKQNSPDMYDVMKILGEQKVGQRIDSALQNI